MMTHTRYEPWNSRSGLERSQTFHEQSRLCNDSTFEGANRIGTSRTSQTQSEFPSLPGLEEQRSVHNQVIVRVPQTQSCRRENTMTGPWRIAAGVPSYRVGKGGASWRHIKQCKGYMGNVITFLDGTTKLRDCAEFGPSGYPASREDTLVSSGQSSFRCWNRPNLTTGPQGQSLPVIFSQPMTNHQPLPLSRNPTRSVSFNMAPSPQERLHMTPQRRLVPTSIQGRIMRAGAQY